MTFLLFFPQNSHSRLINRAMKSQVLQLLHFFVSILVDSTKIFYLEKKFTDFDPHVGDTLCQIRACMILDIFKNHSLKGMDEILEEFKALESEKNKIVRRIDEFNASIKKNDSHYHKDLDKNESMEEFFQAQGIVFSITPDLIFLAQARLLTLFSKVDAQGMSKGVDYDKFYQEIKISKTLAKKITHYYQQNISKLSCEFIYTIASKYYQCNNVVKLFPYLLHVDSDLRSVLPAYEVTKILLHYLHLNNVPILVILEKEDVKTDFDLKNKEKFLFIPSANSLSFRLLQEDEKLLTDNPCLIIRATTKKNHHGADQFLSHVHTLGLNNLILMNMAKHPQYSDIKSASINSNPYCTFKDANMRFDKGLSDWVKNAENEFLHMQKLAEKHGCCAENSSLFFIKHIYCDRISNQIEFN